MRQRFKYVYFIFYIVLSMLFIIVGCDCFGTYRIVIETKSAKGLRTGSPITMAGLEIGEVENIQISSGDVRITAKIDKKIKIPVNSTFSIDTHNILGDKSITVVRAHGDQFIQDGAIVKAKVTVSRTASIGDILDSFTNARENQDRLRNIEKKLDKIISILDKTDQAVQEGQ